MTWLETTVAPAAPLLHVHLLLPISNLSSVDFPSQDPKPFLLSGLGLHVVVDCLFLWRLPNQPEWTKIVKPFLD